MIGGRRNDVRAHMAEIPSFHDYEPRPTDSVWSGKPDRRSATAGVTQEVTIMARKTTARLRASLKRKARKRQERKSRRKRVRGARKRK